MPINKRSLEEAISEVSRELSVRRRCYTRWIQDGKLSQVEANDRVERLEKALDELERLLLLRATDVPIVDRNTTDGKEVDTALHGV